MTSQNEEISRNQQNLFDQEVAGRKSRFGESGFVTKRQKVKFGEAGQIIGADIIVAFLGFDSIFFSKFLMLSPNWHASVI